MSKICKSCGEYYSGDYCEKCGYGNKELKVKSADKYKKAAKKRGAAESSIYAPKGEQAENVAKKRNSKNLLIILIVIAVAVIAAGLVKSGVFSQGDKTDVINDYFAAINERDFDKYINCFPAEMKADLKKDREALGCSKEEYMDQFAEEFEKDYGKGFTIKAECGKQKVLNDYNMDEYKETYGKVPSISEAYVVSVTLNITGPEKSEEAHMECYVGKVGFKWKLFNIEQVAGTIEADSDFAE